MDKIKCLFKNKLTVVASCVLVIALGAAGIIAYLTAFGSANNTFIIGFNEIKLVEEFTPPSELKPGVVISKKVSVKNSGLTKCYVRVLAVFSDSDMGKYCEVDYNTEDWVYNEGDGYWYYTEAIAAGKSTKPLFTKITLSKDIPEVEIKDFDVIVYSESYQSNGFDSYEAAWENYRINKPVIDCGTESEGTSNEGVSQQEESSEVEPSGSETVSSANETN